MQVIVKLHPEMFVKSRSLRKRQLKLLVGNIRQVCKRREIAVVVENRWDKLTVKLKTDSEQDIDQLLAVLSRIPGIDQLQMVRYFPFHDLSTAAEIVASAYADRLRGKTFMVRVKRRGEHPFTSVEAGREIGGYLLHNCDNAGVKIKGADCVVDVTIENDMLMLIDREYSAIGGYPIPSQGNVLSLISGGFDSAVASYQMMRRGARVHFCFFNLSGKQHEIAVKQVAAYLWQEFSSSHNIRFISVDFEPVVEQILSHVDSGLMGVVLKRMMLRAAAQVTDIMGVDAMVTGESIGQVSSQTMANLSAIDRVTEQLVLRPLVCIDKQEIVDTARQIGVEELVKSIPEYCAVISQKPAVAADLNAVLAEETKLNLDIVSHAVTSASRMDVKDIVRDIQTNLDTVDRLSVLTESSILIDIRGPQEALDAPLEVTGHKVLTIPFYKLQREFPDLSKSKQYYLYCERGVMSQLQASLLHEQGYTNVRIYQP